MLYEYLTTKIEQAPKLDFGEIFSRSIELFKKSWLQGFIFVLLSFLLVLPAMLIVYIPLLGLMAANEYSTRGMNADPELSFWEIFPFLLLFFPVMVLANSIVMALTAGFFRLLKKVDHGGDAATGELFVFLKWEYIKKTLVLSLMVIVISVAAGLLFVLPAIYTAVPVYFVTVIFAFNSELSAVEILKAAFKLGTKKWWLAFGLILVCSLLAQLVGLLLCGVGVFFTTPFVYQPLYHIYKEVVGFHDIRVESTPDDSD